jgi:uncharacterized protein (UPF0335 family)
LLSISFAAVDKELLACQRRQWQRVSPLGLRIIVERIERLSEEKAALQADIKDIMAEAKSAGFTPKVIRVVLKIRKMEPEVREELNAEVATYLRVLGDNHAGEDDGRGGGGGGVVGEGVDDQLKTEEGGGVGGRGRRIGESQPPPPPSLCPFLS